MHTQMLKLINSAKLLNIKSTLKRQLCLHTLTTNKKEVNETIPFTRALKTIKYFGINSTKEAKDLYTKNYKTLFVEIKENTSNKKTSCFHRLEGLILLRCQSYSKQSTDSI